MSDQLWRWTATQLSEGIRSRTISSREATQSCLARLEEVNPTINAVADPLADEALAAANKADEAVGRAEPLGPLHGVPVTVKINVDFSGRATTNGVVAFREKIAGQDSIPVANLRKSGAVIVGRTNVPGFSTRYFTDNPLHGRTLNPWDPTRTPGGSSGGAAAAVASGICPIGHGNDRAGSIRQPAFACGVFGLRPTMGRVPDLNPSTEEEERGLSSQFTHVQGPLARTVDDLRLGLAALSARDARDPWWVPAAQIPAGDACRVAMIATSPGVDADPAVIEAVRRAARWLEETGYQVEEIEPPRLAEAAHIFYHLLMTEEYAASAGKNAASSAGIDQLGDEAVKRARAGTRAYAGIADLNGYVRALATRSTILREWLVFLERYPLILMPVSWQRPWPIDFDQRGDEAVREMLDAHHPLLAVSLLGLPSVAAPTGLVDGIPMGVQLVASRFCEERCLCAAEVIENCNDLVTPIDPVLPIDKDGPQVGKDEAIAPN